MRNLGAGTIALMISVLFWGILLGGVAYSHIVYFPVYLGDLPESSVLVTGKYALHEEVFWLFLHPVLIISLIVSLVLNWRFRSRRAMILVAMLVYLGALIITGIYFVPNLIAFSQSAASSIAKDEWMSRGWWWQRWSWLRGAVLFIAYFALLRALVMPRLNNSDA